MSGIDAGAEPAPQRGGAYDYSGSIHWEYSPEMDHEPDPGEIVWTWVAFEEDASIGKDRPVAIVGRADDRRLVALMLSSQDHAGDRDWMSIGTGPWDKRGRESWLRRDRVLAVEASAVRREGAILPRPTFDRIASSLRASSGGSTKSSRPADKQRAGILTRLRRLFAG